MCVGEGVGAKIICGLVVSKCLERDKREMGDAAGNWSRLALEAQWRTSIIIHLHQMGYLSNVGITMSYHLG